MYDEENIIDVRISTISDERKDPLVEYTPQPNSALFEQNKIEHGPNVCYIAPPAGLRFAVDVCIHRHASFMGQPEFDVTCTVDGLFEAFHGIVKPPGRKRVHALTQTIDTYPAIIGGRRYKCGFAFAAVKTNDDPSFMSGEEEDVAIREMGKIEVVLQRGRLKSKKKKKKEKDSERPLLDSCARQDEVTKKVSKDNGKALFTKLLPLQTIQRCATDNDKEYFFVAATGDAGKKIKFVFYYTTKLYLQVQQIIPIITKAGLRSEPVVVHEDDATPSPVTPNNAPDAQEQELAFTSSRPIKIETDAIAIKDEPESDEEEEQEQDENEETESANSAAELHSEGADYNPSEMNAFRSPRPDSEEEDLYTSSVPPRHIRGPSISSDTFAMHGGLGERSASPPRPSVQFAQSIDSSAPSPSTGQGQTSTKRKAPHEKDAADHDVEDAELALLEIQAKRRLNAARRVRDSLVPFGEE